MEEEVLKYRMYRLRIMKNQKDIIISVFMKIEWGSPIKKSREHRKKKKGEYYWRNKPLCEIKQPKDEQFSLINAYREHIIP